MHIPTAFYRMLPYIFFHNNCSTGVALLSKIPRVFLAYPTKMDRISKNNWEPEQHSYSLRCRMVTTEHVLCHIRSSLRIIRKRIA